MRRRLAAALAGTPAMSALLLEFLRLLLFQAAGTGLVMLTQLAVPGPVAGMLLLAGWLGWRGELPPALAWLSALVQRHLALLFIPAGVGLITQRERLASEGLALAAVLSISTLLAMLTTVWCYRRLRGTSG